MVHLIIGRSAATEGKGVHSGKEQPAPKPPTNVSEVRLIVPPYIMTVIIYASEQSAQRANSFLSGYKRLGRIPAVVDYVASGSRFK